MLAAFDWSAPPPPLPPKTLEDLYMGTPLDQRLLVWQGLSDWAMAKLIGREIQADPDGAQKVLNKLHNEKLIAQAVNIREKK